jgi:hypothetical protein
VVLINHLMLVGRMCQFNGPQHSVDHHRRPEPGAEIRKKQTACLAASQRLLDADSEWLGSPIDNQARRAEEIAGAF